MLGFTVVARNLEYALAPVDNAFPSNSGCCVPDNSSSGRLQCRISNRPK